MEKTCKVLSFFHELPLITSLSLQRRGAISYDSSDQTALYIRMLGKCFPVLTLRHTHAHFANVRNVQFLMVIVYSQRLMTVYTVYILNNLIPAFVFISVTSSLVCNSGSLLGLIRFKVQIFCPNQSKSWCVAGAFSVFPHAFVYKLYVCSTIHLP